MRRDWLNSTASPTPPMAASRSACERVVSVTMSEADSTAQSETSVQHQPRAGST